MPGSKLKEILTLKKEQIRFCVNIKWNGSQDIEMISRLERTMKSVIAKNKKLNSLTDQMGKAKNQKQVKKVISEQQEVITNRAPQGIDTGTLQGYYVMGKRTNLIIGFADSELHLHGFVRGIVAGIDVEADISLLVTDEEIYPLGSPKSK